MKPIFTGLTVITACIGCAAITLPEAQRQLFARNYDIAIVRQESVVHELEVEEARSVWHPFIRAAGSYVYQTEVPQIELEIAPFPPMQKSLGDKDRVEAGFDVGYAFPLGMSNFHSVKSRELAMAADCEVRLSLENRVSFDLGMLYFAWDMACRAVETQQALLNQLDSYAAQVRDLRDAGVATSARVSEAEARHAMAAVQLGLARDRVDSLKLEFAFMIQSKDTALSPEPYPFPQDSSLEQLALEAPLNTDRPEVRTMNLSMARLAAARRALSGSRFPVLTAAAGYRVANPGINMGADEFMGYGQAAVNLSWNIYDGLKTRAQMEQMRSGALVVQLQKEKLVDNLGKAVALARQRTLQAKRQMEAAQATVAATELFAQDLKNAVDAGTATPTDYLNALTSVAQAKLSYDQAACALKMSFLSLLFTNGETIKY